jgi:hypothetical protein
MYGVLVLVALVAALILAHFKQRDTSAWALISFLFPPAVLLLLFLPAARSRGRRGPSWDERDDRETEREYGREA